MLSLAEVNFCDLIVLIQEVSRNFCLFKSKISKKDFANYIDFESYSSQYKVRFKISQIKNTLLFNILITLNDDINKQIFLPYVDLQSAKTISTQFLNKYENDELPSN